MAEAIYLQPGQSVDWTPTAAVAAGEIIQLKDGRAAFAPTAIAAGELGAVQVGGIVTVLKSVTQAMLVSNKVFWDTSASKCNLLHGGSSDFFLGTVIEDAAYAGTTVKVNLNAKPVYNLSLDQGYHSAPIQTAGDVYVNGAGNSVNLFFGVTAEAMKADALSLRAIATGTPGVLQALVCINLNGDDAAFDFNVGLANDSHATDADQIANSLFLHTDGGNLSLFFESDNVTAEEAAADSAVDAVVGTPFLVTWDLRNWADIQVYVNGVAVLPEEVYSLAGAAGPMKLLAHMEKGANDSPGNITVMDLGFTSFDV